MKSFTIGNLMTAVLRLAVGFAALRNPLSATLASLVFTLAMFVILTATLGSTLTATPARAAIS
jgi:hypothetical protein